MSLAARPALPPSAVELHLLLDPPGYQTRSRRAAILAASLAAHLFFFLIAIRLPAFISPDEPQRRVVVRRIPLYLPPDILTQKAPNRNKISKSIDLADLLPAASEQSRRPSPGVSRRQFELPKQTAVNQPAHNAPQILQEAPNIALSQPPKSLPIGSATALPAPPQPAPVNNSPFQDVGTETPNPHPPMAPPKATVQAAINGLARTSNGNQTVMSDDSNAPADAGSPGAIGQLGSQHSAVELQSDPQGADFKPYLTRILAIVRSNWRRVVPESARMGTLRGRTIMEFIIDHDGRIVKIVTAASSGADPLDRAAIAGLSMSNPLPPLPADFKGSQVRLAFTFSYNVATPQ